MKVKGNILYAELNNFTNNETGEINLMTKIGYTVERENTDNFVGVALLEAYKPGNYLKELENYVKAVNMNGQAVKKLVDIEVREQYVKNGMKFVVEKINDFDFKKK